jgi:GTP pyrophosphokinase
MATGCPERVIEVEWSRTPAPLAALYPVDVAVEAADRQGLLRDISEVFSREKMNVIGVQACRPCELQRVHSRLVPLHALLQC